MIVSLQALPWQVPIICLEIQKRKEKKILSWSVHEREEHSFSPTQLGIYMHLYLQQTVFWHTLSPPTFSPDGIKAECNLVRCKEWTFLSGWSKGLKTIFLTTGNGMSPFQTLKCSNHSLTWGKIKGDGAIPFFFFNLQFSFSTWTILH